MGNVGLPYAFTDQGLVANTMDAHRVLAWCGTPEAQDKAVEVIFRGYFAEERAPNDRALLIEACVAAGKSEADAIARPGPAGITRSAGRPGRAALRHPAAGQGPR